MTLSVRKWLARQVRDALKYSHTLQLVAITEPHVGFYRIQVLQKNFGKSGLGRTMVMNLLLKVPSIFAVYAEVNDTGVGQLVFHATA